MLLRAISPFFALAGLARGTALPRAPSLGTWTALANVTSNGVQLPRQEHSVVAVGNDVYALGGIFSSSDGGNVTFPTVAKAQKYSTTSDTWSDLPDMPMALNHANVAVVHGKVYVLGGLADTPSDPSFWSPSGASSVYDPSTNKWTVLPEMPADRVVGAAATVAIGNVIYLAGGIRYTNLTIDDEDTVAYFSSYDTTTKKWTTLPDMPAPRDHAGKGAVGNNLYVLGGRAHGHWNVKADAYAYNIKTNRWTTVASLPLPRGGMASATIGHLIYAAGGEGDVDSPPSNVFPQMQAYDTISNKWINFANMTRPIHGTDAAAVNGKIYIPAGGWAVGGTPTAWTSSFTP